MGHNIEQGLGGLSFVEIQRFCGKTFETDCPKGNEKHNNINLFELPSVLEYQFCENRIAFSITYLLNCIGIQYIMPLYCACCGQYL